jgi:hypothetical protein
MRTHSSKDEGEQCRRLAAELIGEPEHEILLRIARMWDHLALEQASEVLKAA